MRKRLLACVMLTLMAGVACEAEHGKGGFIDRAVAKDLRENGPHNCKNGETWRPPQGAPSDCEGDEDLRPECRVRCRGPGE